MELAESLKIVINIIDDSNTRVVLTGTSLLGFAAGAIGAFTLLRRRALVSDALAHAALPGICVSYLLVGSKSFVLLLLGAAASCFLAMLLISVAGYVRRLTEDSLIGIILSSFFGIGICLSRIIQNRAVGDQAGVDSYIFGKTASMLSSDAALIAAASAIVLLCCLLFKKEFVISSFDPQFAKSTGLPVRLIDFVLLFCVVVTTLVGLQAVGVVLIIALLITPPAAARLWTKRISTLVLLSALFGTLSSLTGTLISAQIPRLPTGPLIVIVAAVIFLLSTVLAPFGLIAKALTKRRNLPPQVFDV